MTTIRKINPIVSIIASEKQWVDGEAIQQLQAVSAWPGMERIVGMPDLHPGKGCPVGASFLTRDWIYPTLIGNDIGCGMGLWALDLQANKLKLDHIEKTLQKIILPSKDNIDKIESLLTEYQIEVTPFDTSLGTIGGGNHFSELLAVESIENEMCFNKLGLKEDAVFLLVHSGSRGYGELILQNHLNVFANKGLAKDGIEFQNYFNKHNNAVKWAKLNRMLIANAFVNVLNTEQQLILDICHNFVELTEQEHNLFLHRKGAAPTDKGPVIIPGSRGSYSFLVKPQENAPGKSVAHGAGRKWKRSECKSRLSKNFSVDSLKRTAIGSRVICQDRNLLFEEAAQAYKNIKYVVNDLVMANSCEIIAVFRPILTFKKGDN